MKEQIKKAARIIKEEDDKKKGIGGVYNQKPMNSSERTKYLDSIMGEDRNTNSQARNMIDLAKKIIKKEIPTPVKKTEEKKEFTLKPIVGSYRSGKKNFEEASLQLKRQSLVTSVDDVRVEYAKGIINAIKLYEDLLVKANQEYDMGDLVDKLKHHLEEDKVELESALSILSKEAVEKVMAFKKYIYSSKAEGEPVDLMDEVTTHLKSNDQLTIPLQEAKAINKILKRLKATPADVAEARLFVKNHKGKLLTTSQQKTFDKYKKIINKYDSYLNESNAVVGGKSDNLTIEDIAKKHNVSTEVIQYQIEKGMVVEREHTDSDEVASEIAMDHLSEFPDYYDRLDKMESHAKEALKKKEDILPLTGEVTDVLDLGDKLTKDEKKLLAKEKTIDEKNEFDEDEDTSFGASNLVSKYINDELTNLSEMLDIMEKEHIFLEGSNIKKDIEFLTKDTPFSCTSESLFVNTFLMFKMNNKDIELGLPQKKAGLLGGAAGGSMSTIDSMYKYYKSDKLATDRSWFYENIAKKGTAVRKSIEEFENIKSAELAKANDGNVANIKGVKTAWGNAYKNIMTSLKEHKKDIKKEGN